MSYAKMTANFDIGKKHLRRMPGLYGLGDSSAPVTLAQIQQIAQNNGVDPNLIAQGAAEGMDTVQLLLIADGSVNPALELSDYETMMSVVSEDEANPTAASAAPAASGISSWFSQYWPLLAVAGGVLVVTGMSRR